MISFSSVDCFCFDFFVALRTKVLCVYHTCIKRNICGAWSINQFLEEELEHVFFQSNFCELNSLQQDVSGARRSSHLNSREIQQHCMLSCTCSTFLQLIAMHYTRRQHYCFHFTERTVTQRMGRGSQPHTRLTPK